MSLAAEEIKTTQDPATVINLGAVGVVTVTQELAGLGHEIVFWAVRRFEYGSG